MHSLHNKSSIIVLFKYTELCHNTKFNFLNPIRTLLLILLCFQFNLYALLIAIQLFSKSDTDVSKLQFGLVASCVYRHHLVY